MCLWNRPNVVYAVMSFQEYFRYVYHYHQPFFQVFRYSYSMEYQYDYEYQRRHKQGVPKQMEH